MNSESEKLKLLLEQSILDESLRKVVLSRPVRRADDECRRIDVRQVDVAGEMMLQFSRRIGNQEYHSNHSVTDVMHEFQKEIGHNFRHVTLYAAGVVWTARYSKKGNCRLSRKSEAGKPPPIETRHDRKRTYLIPDDRVVPFLVSTGIMTAQGRVRSKHQDKFRQINRYVEFIKDVLPQLPAEGVLRVVDFGSGKSYLTFATHYYLTKVLNREVQITGIDRRKDVVQKCTDVADQLGLSGISFVVGDIADFAPTDPVHLAVSLHACDTATDDALLAALKWKADVIFAVPCCHHELSAALTDDDSFFTSHGIIRERFAELATDTIRAELLEAVGYKTDVVEFIELEHTARNVLIRAVRRNKTDVRHRREHWLKVRRFCAEHDLPSLRLQQHLEQTALLPEIEPSMNMNHS